MPLLNVGLAQINVTVGDLSANVEKCFESAVSLADQGAQLIVLPEMAITGYPVEDLVLRPDFQQDSVNHLHLLAARLKSSTARDCVTVVGFLRPNPDGGKPFNSAAVISHGEVIGIYDKHHLPNYGVFDEYRYFSQGHENLVIRLNEIDVAIAICEDLWQDGGPVARVRDLDAGLLVVLNGSPYERNKDDIRLDLCHRRSVEAGCTLAYVNLVGGQDELVFDGDSLVTSEAGELLTRLPQFVECLKVLELELPTAKHETAPSRIITVEEKRPLLSDSWKYEALSEYAEVYQALVLGLRDYVSKNNFASVILGLSGGIDSALVAAIACDAIGADRVYGISMPSEFSSAHSKSDAQETANRTGLNFRTISIAPMVKTFQDELALTGLAQENLQARMRGMTLMGLSNQEGHLVLATGNKSELAVGYSTIYGDAVGGYAPIKDIPKVDVWELAKWRNSQAIQSGEIPPIPEDSISKPPSAELRPGQLDSDSLPDYELLDRIIEMYVEQDASRREIIDCSIPAELVDDIINKIDRAEYKRRQYPPGTKISSRAFGRDRRLPITNGWNNQVR